MTAVHQVIPVLAPHDAVGGHTLRVQRALAAAGYESLVFAEVILGEAPPGARRLDEFDAAVGGGADLLVYQASTGSSAADWLHSRSEPFTVNYHNVTPARFFAPWAPEAADNMRRARNQLRALAPRAVGALADSAYNAAELVEMGYRDVVVAPLLLDLDGPPPPPDPHTGQFLGARRRGAHWLFVGRLAPNKCQHDVIAAFAVYRAVHDPGARLSLVGSPAAQAYAESLLAISEELGVDDAVTMVGGLSDAELSAYYDDADVFVCLSEHEGFCIPVLEAMRHQTPVIAYAEAAVPDTVGSAAVLLPEKDPHLVATAVQSLLHDPVMCNALAVAGAARVADFASRTTVPHFVDAISRVVHQAATRIRG